MTPRITGKALPEWYRSALLRILATAGCDRAHATSYARDEPAQAVAMYNNCKRTGAAAQYAIYLPAGDEIVRVYEQNMDKPRDQAIALMERRIREVGLEKVTKHGVPADASFGVADLSQASIRHPAAFIGAAKADPQYRKLLIENNVYHLELNKAA